MGINFLKFVIILITLSLFEVGLLQEGCNAQEQRSIESTGGDVHISVSNEQELYSAVNHPIADGFNRYIELFPKSYVLLRPLEIKRNTVLRGMGTGARLIRNFSGKAATMIIKGKTSIMGRIHGPITWGKGSKEEFTYKAPGDINPELHTGQHVLIESSSRNKNVPPLFCKNIYLGKDDSGSIMFEQLPSYTYRKGDVIRNLEPLSIVVSNINIIAGNKAEKTSSDLNGYRYTYQLFKSKVAQSSGISIEGGFDIEILHVKIEHHKVGISLRYSHHVRCNDVLLKRNFFHIVAENCSALTIEGSRFFDSYRTGLLISSVNNFRLLNSLVDSTALLQGGGGDAITISNSSNILVSSNNILRAGCYGIFIGGNSVNAMIVNNIISSGVTGACIIDWNEGKLRGKTSFIIIKNNIIENNAWSISPQGESHDVIFSGNIVANRNTDRRTTFHERKNIVIKDNLRKIGNLD